jgi:hypothetical protein
MKIKETSEIVVLSGDKKTIVKGGFIDVHDAYEYVINRLGESDDNDVFVIDEEIRIARIE